jgi:arylsulfatase
MEVYAAMVDRVDQGIGNLVDELEKHNALDNTILIYLQDNGGCAEGFGRQSNAEKIAGKSFPPLGRDGLQTKIWTPMQTRDGRPVRTGPETMPGAEDTFVAYGKGWANVSNTPFSGYKHDGREGGISTPFIMHWPDGIATKYRGWINHNPTHLIDVMPTLLDAAKIDYPTERNGQSILPAEGISLLPALSGQSLVREQPLGFEHHGNLALRDGDWKIVSMYQKGQPTKWQLFNLADDRTELHDLAESNPQKLAEMVGQWETWAEHVGVVKWPFETK